LAGVLPIRRAQLGAELVAGLTLAALAVPEVLGYARIAGMPVSTGLYTMLVPAIVFAVFGASRHLVVGADSATAAILAAGLTGLAAQGSDRYVALAGTTAVLVAGLLLIARVLRVGFLANFLSRTVLVGFLTGVGIQVAVGQLGDMVGVAAQGSTLHRFGQVATELSSLKPLPMTVVLAMAVALAVVVLVLVLRRVARAFPAALLAVVGAIVASRALDLQTKGLAVVGPVPAGLPHPVLPGLTVADVRLLLPTTVSMVVVILAQSAATARAYAARYDERPDVDRDLVGLAGANLAAALTGAFVVNGSPTKTQMVDGAGGRSQLAQLAASAVVIVVLIGLTGPLAGLPLAALAAVVFLIGVELIDVAELRRLWSVRRAEFGIAVLTAASVVLLGIEAGIAVAVTASIIDHLRHSYAPHNAVMTKSSAGHWHTSPITAGVRTVAGLVIYRFGTSMYFANASRLTEDISALLHGDPIRWFCFDCTAIGDVDYTAGTVLGRVSAQMTASGTRVVLAGAIDPVRAQLEAYGLTFDADAYLETPGEALARFEAGDGQEKRAT
jgi:MFS superfamily sulfate permease-like transporter